MTAAATSARDITVVLPVYNEAARLPATLRRLSVEAAARPDWHLQLVVADDGSTDGCGDIARSWSNYPRPEVVSCGRHRGKGAALKVGASRANAPIVAFLDADMPVSLDSVLDMAGTTAEADLVLGSRRLPGAVVRPRQPPLRRVGSVGFLWAVRTFGYVAASDPQCGVKVYRRSPMASVLEATSIERFGFDIELISRARQCGMRVVEVPVNWRHAPGSTLRPFRDGITTLGDLWRLRRSGSLPLT